MNSSRPPPGAVDASVEELIALLKRTSLPTVIVEGTDDMIVYRRLEERLNHLGVSVLPVGGRLKVLDIFLRRTEIPASVKLAFIADQDTWIYSGVPAEYRNSRLVLTSGYSIENDVFSDGNFVSLLAGQEQIKFGIELQQFIQWYSLALSRHLVNKSVPISFHPNHVLDADQRAALLSLARGESYPESLRGQIQTDYQRLLRGKSLIALLIRNTNYAGRVPHHSDRALLEMVSVRPGPLLGRVSSQLEVLMSS